MISEGTITILLVDDDQEYRHGLQRLLRLIQGEQETRILEADSGAAGVDIMKAEHVDCVLLDCMMPGGNGPEWIETMLQVDKSTMIIMLTGDGSSTLADECRQRGATDCISKTAITPDLLKKTITQALCAANGDKE